eukprot:gene162-975_t
MDDTNLLDSKKMAIRALLEVTEAASKNMEIAIVTKSGISFLDDEEVDKLAKEVNDQMEADGAKK